MTARAPGTTWWLGRGPVLGSLCAHAALLTPWVLLLVADRDGVGDGASPSGRTVRVAMADPDPFEELAEIESIAVPATLAEHVPERVDAVLDAEVTPLAEEVPPEPEPIDERTIEAQARPAPRLEEPQAFPARAFEKPPWERTERRSEPRTTPVEVPRGPLPEPKAEARPRPAPSPMGSGVAAETAAGERVLPRRLAAASPTPNYPASLAAAGITGTVRLRVLVSATGAPEQVAIHASSGHAVLDRLAAETVRRSWRFEPGTRGGTPEAMTVLLRFRFEPD